MLNVVALIAPLATISRIDKEEVIEKHKVEIPNRVGDIVVCPDRFCITNHEEVPGKFFVMDNNPLTLRCHYCETMFLRAIDQGQGKEVGSSSRTRSTPN